MGQLGMREGFDVGFEMSGHASALQEMLSNMAHGGKIAMLACQPRTSDRLVAPCNEHDHDQGIYGREMFETWLLDVRA